MAEEVNATPSQVHMAFFSLSLVMAKPCSAWTGERVGVRGSNNPQRQPLPLTVMAQPCSA
jgi:hypothetical protein